MTFEQVVDENLNLPEFFVTHCKLQSIQNLQKLISNFKDTFKTKFESEWILFILEEM